MSPGGEIRGNVAAATDTRAGAAAPWLVMVHALAQDHRLFSTQAAAFCRDYRLLRVDLPGHGRAAATQGPFGLGEYADGVQRALDAAGVDRGHFWGTHTGAGVGLLLAAHTPQRFASLVLEGAIVPGRPLPHSARVGIERARATARSRGIAAARREWFEVSRWFDVMRTQPERCRAAAQWEMVAEFPGGPWLDPSPPRPVPDLTDKLAELRLPVLLVNGEHELPDFVEVADELERILPDVERARIAGAGGFPLWEFPEAVNACVRRFLDSRR